jgi:hypothetical protein
MPDYSRMSDAEYTDAAAKENLTRELLAMADNVMRAEEEYALYVDSDDTKGLVSIAERVDDLAVSVRKLDDILVFPPEIIDVANDIIEEQHWPDTNEELILAIADGMYLADKVIAFLR